MIVMMITIIIVIMIIIITIIIIMIIIIRFDDHPSAKQTFDNNLNGTSNLITDNNIKTNENSSTQHV